MVTLAPVAHADRDALLAFELANRTFFEASLNARPAAYYSPAGVAEAIDAAIAAAAADRGYQFLVKSEDGEIVGRINLRDVERVHFHAATLGYRMAQAHSGKGHASAAVDAMLHFAFNELGLLRVEANAGVQNAGSIKVLLRNGFVQFGRSLRSLQLADVWHDRLHFERHAETV